MTRAAILESAPGELVVDDIKIGDVGPREVRIRTVAAGLCHSDLHFIQGLYPYPLPAVLGHESAGVVEAVGNEVHDFAVGDHVVSCVSGFCGACRYCLTGRPYLCAKVGLHRPMDSPPRLTRRGEPLVPFFDLASFSEELLVHEHYIVKIRPDMPLEKAALLGCGVTTGLGAVLNTAQVGPGDTVAVIGCGGIGLNAVQGAALAGAARIIAIDRLATKLTMAQSFGATDVIDASEVEPVEAVLELTRGEGVDHAVEAIGLKITAQQAFAMVGRGGTATIIGMVPVGQALEIDATMLLSGKRLQGSNMGSNRFRIDIPRYVDWYLAGQLELDALVSATMALDDINDGFAALATGELARQLILFD